MAVHEKAGLFDISHMGEVHCTGFNALGNLDYIMTNDFSNMNDGQVCYTLMAPRMGGCIDDLLIYKYKENDYCINLNASNTEKDFKWMLEHQFGDCEFTNLSAEISQIAFQVPNAVKVLEKLATSKCLDLKYYRADFYTEIQGIPCVISRTGYTGVVGFLKFMPSMRMP